MDYTVETLKQYFREMGYTKEDIDLLLETNPFDDSYTTWEKEKRFECKYFADTIKKLHVMNIHDKVCEICVNPTFRVSASMFNEKTYKLIPQFEKYDFYIPEDHTVIINGLYYNTDILLKKLKLNNIPFAIGAVGIDNKYFETCRRFYTAMSYKYGVPKYEEENRYGKKIVMIYSKKTSF